LPVDVILKSMTTFLRGLFAAIGLAALAHAEGGTKAITDTHCQIQVPSDWSETKVGGAGARSPEDQRFNAIVRGFTSDDYQAVVDAMKQTKGTVVDENGNRILLEVPVFGGRKQYIAITKTHPLGCRTSVTFADGKEPAARKIAESVKPLK